MNWYAHSIILSGHGSSYSIIPAVKIGNWYNKKIVLAWGEPLIGEVRTGTDEQPWFIISGDSRKAYQQLKQLGFFGKKTGDYAYEWGMPVANITGNPQILSDLQTMGVGNLDLVGAQPSAQPAQPQVEAPPPPPPPPPNITAWILGKTTGFEGDPVGKPAVVGKSPDGNWIVMNRSGDQFPLSNEQIGGAIKSIKDDNGQSIQSADPAELFKIFDEMQQKTQTPEKSLSKERPSPEEVRLPDKFMSVYNRAIEQKFLEGVNPDGTPEDIMINALAGTGKTTMLKHLSSFIKEGERWLYLVFNKKNQLEASTEFPEGVDVATTHAFLGSVLKNSGEEVGGGTKLPGMDEKGTKLSRTLDQLVPRDSGRGRNRRYNSVYRQFRWNATSRIKRIAELAKAFAINPSDPDISQKLLGIVKKYAIDMDLSNERQSQDRDYTPDMLEHAKELLSYSLPGALPDQFDRKDARVRDQDDTLWYAAVHADEINWSGLGYNVVLMDEAQDFNMCQLVVAQKLKEAGVRVIGVGDPHQCVIEGTLITGADGKNVPVEELACGMSVLAAKGKGRTGCYKIKDIFKRKINDEPVVEITTESGKILTTTPEHTHFADFDCNYTTCGRKQAKTWFVYLMYKAPLGYRMGITQNYKLRRSGETADAMWIIKTCDTEEEARYYEQFYATTYRLPTWLFKTEGRKVGYNADLVKRLFNNINTGQNAILMADDLGFSLAHPHYRPKCQTTRKRRNFTIILCGDPRFQPLHSYAISGSDMQDSQKIQHLGLKTRPARGRKGWRSESAHANLGEVYQILDRVKTSIDLNVIEKARFIKNKSLPFCQARNILPGMEIFTHSGKDIIIDKVKSIRRFKYTGYVYDLNIDRVHNFIAGNIVTHNSIYGWRGADAEAFQKLEDIATEGRSPSMPLPINFRSLPPIIDFVNQNTHVNDLEPAPQEFWDAKGIDPNSAQISVDIQDEDFMRQIQKEYAGERHLEQETAIVSRTNAPLVETALSMLKNNIDFQILGRDLSKELIDHINKVTWYKPMMKSLPELDRDLAKFIDDLQFEWSGKVSKQEELKEIEQTTEALQGVLRHVMDPEFIRKEKRKVTTASDFIAYIEEKLSGQDPDNARDYAKLKERQRRDPTAFVTLTTAHKSKGMEYERLFIMSPGSFDPSREQIKTESEAQQERNLWYVSLTRAKSNLIIGSDKEPGN